MRRSKAYAPRKMRDNNKPTQCKAPLWLMVLDMDAKKAMSADVGPDGLSRVKLEDFIKSQGFKLMGERLELARERYTPFFVTAESQP